jgi:ureidoacrylate peracid hydrolase
LEVKGLLEFREYEGGRHLPTEERLLTTLSELVDLQYTALVVVDMQNDFAHRNGFFGKGGYNPLGGGVRAIDMTMCEQMAPKLLRLMSAARTAGGKIYHVRSFFDDRYLPPMLRLRKRRIGRTADVCPEGKWGSEQLEGFEPQPGDRLITKHVHSAFIGTDLRNVLESDGIKSLIVTGVATEICVESTVRDGCMTGFYIVVPRDCVATYLRDVHERSLAQFGAYWAWVTDSDEIMRIWGAQQ